MLGGAFGVVFRVMLCSGDFGAKKFQALYTRGQSSHLYQLAPRKDVLFLVHITGRSTQQSALEEFTAIKTHKGQIVLSEMYRVQLCHSPWRAKFHHFRKDSFNSTEDPGFCHSHRSPPIIAIVPRPQIPSRSLVCWEMRLAAERFQEPGPTLTTYVIRDK